MKVNMVVTALNVSILIFFMIVGSIKIKPSNWVSVNNSFAPYGVGSIFKAAGSIFFSYLGFDTVSSLAEEVKKPKRDLPLGIIGSLLTTATLYIGVSIVLTGMVDFRVLNYTGPLSQALDDNNLDWAAKIVAIGAVLALSATTLTGLVGQPRIFYRMAKDGLLFPFFADVNKRTGVPIFGTILTGIVTALIAFFTPEDTLADAISIGTLSAFSVVDAGVIVLRYRSKQHPNRAALLTLIFSILIMIASFFLCLS